VRMRAARHRSSMTRTALQRGGDPRAALASCPCVGRRLPARREPSPSPAGADFTPAAAPARRGRSGRPRASASAASRRQLRDQHRFRAAHPVPEPLQRRVAAGASFVAPERPTRRAPGRRSPPRLRRCPAAREPPRRDRRYASISIRAPPALLTARSTQPAGARSRCRRRGRPRRRAELLAALLCTKTTASTSCSGSGRIALSPGPAYPARARSAAPEPSATRAPPIRAAGVVTGTRSSAASGSSRGMVTGAHDPGVAASITPITTQLSARLVTRCTLAPGASRSMLG
jgi:hypothetical protein